VVTPIDGQVRDIRGNPSLRGWLEAWQQDREQHAIARAQARALVLTRPGERLLAVARGAGGELLAATDRALYHQASQSWARLGWEEVGQVGWDNQRRILMLTGLTPSVRARTVLCLARDWGLPEVAAERAGAAKVFDQRISLNGGAGARVVARRLPGGQGVKWLVVLDHGLDPADPQLRAELESALTALRAATGIEDGASPEPGLPRRREIPAAVQSGKRAGQSGVFDHERKLPRQARNWARTLLAAWRSPARPGDHRGSGADLPVLRDQPAGALHLIPARQGRRVRRATKPAAARQPRALLRAWDHPLASAAQHPGQAPVAIPAKGIFPVAVVAAHGLLAGSTMVLVLLTALGVGGS
jgi:hypothetical protein